MKKTITILILMLACFVAQAQERLITGTVKDDQGIGLPGVSIVIKGTTKGALIDALGKYQINTKQGDVLIFQSIGYIKQEIVVGTQSLIDVEMIDDTKSLEEIVVIADDEQEKRDITVSIPITKGKKAKKDKRIKTKQ